MYGGNGVKIKYEERGAMKKKLPVGIENFREFFTEDFYYVDKNHVH